MVGYCRCQKRDRYGICVQEVISACMGGYMWELVCRAQVLEPSPLGRQSIA